ncbi:MAG: hypothetical protein ACE5KF_00040 [Kiloniellaceae bacterium]
MDFLSFLVLLVISVVVSGVLHFGFKYYATPGFWSFLSKCVVGWLGAWLGPQVLGNWWTGVAVGQVFIVPAVLGSAAMLVVVVDVAKMWMGSAAGGGGSTT